MRTLVFTGPLGQNFDGAPLQKRWLPIALAAVSVASSIYGGAKASAANKEAARRQRQQEAKEESWYKRRYNEDYVDTAAGQNLIRRAKEYARDNWRKAAGAQAVAGASDAATAQAKNAGNKMVGDTIANIASTDQARKDNVDNLHRQAQDKFAQMDMAREQQRAANITKAAQGASNALMMGALATSQANTSSNLAGGSNNGITTDASGSMQAMRTQAEIDKLRLFGG